MTKEAQEFRYCSIGPCWLADGHDGKCYEDEESPLDPEPLVSDVGVRFAIGKPIPGLQGHFEPRPEYEQDRSKYE